MGLVNLCKGMGFIDFNTNELFYQLLFRGGWKLFNHKNEICKSKDFYRREMQQWGMIEYSCSTSTRITMFMGISRTVEFCREQKLGTESGNSLIKTEQSLCTGYARNRKVIKWHTLYHQHVNLTTLRSMLPWDHKIKLLYSHDHNWKFYHKHFIWFSQLYMCYGYS